MKGEVLPPVGGVRRGLRLGNLAVTVVLAAAITAVAVSVDVSGFLRLDEILGIEERGLLLQRLRRQVVDILATGREAQVEALDILTDIEAFLRVAADTLGREVEGSELTELHLLALEELFEDTRLQLVGHTEADILAIDGVVLRHVLAEFLIGHRLGGYQTGVELAIGLRGRVHVLVRFVNDWHGFEVKSEE